MLTLARGARHIMCAWQVLQGFSLHLSSVLMGLYLTRDYLSVIGGLMWTVRDLLTFTLQLKEHSEEYPRLLRSVPLLLIYLRKSVKDQCLPAGVLGREILTVLTMVYAGNL